MEKAGEHKFFDSALANHSVTKLAWTIEETAYLLGMSIRTLHELRNQHPLYQPDGDRTVIENPKKSMPSWSNELVQLIAFARRLTAQGTRQLTDDEAFRIRVRMGEKMRQHYLGFIEDE